jgi:hypothetical protein
MPPAAYKEELEFGDVVVNAIAAENTGRDWHREDAIIVRAVKASPGGQLCRVSPATHDIGGWVEYGAEAGTPVDGPQVLKSAVPALYSGLSPSPLTTSMCRGSGRGPLSRSSLHRPSSTSPRS